MLIHYVSDLHLEGLQGRSDLTEVRPVEGSDVLVLAGDNVQLRQVGELARFIEPFTERGIPVLYVPGNHEYWQMGTNTGRWVGTADGDMQVSNQNRQGSRQRHPSL